MLIGVTCVLVVTAVKTMASKEAMRIVHALGSHRQQSGYLVEYTVKFIGFID